MDIFIEELVERKKTPVHVLAVVGLSLGCCVLILLSFMVLMPLFPAFSSIIFMVTALAIYFAYKMAVSVNVEYEYSMVNSEVDVDKIQNRSKRTRVATVNVRKTEASGWAAERHEFSKYLSDVTVKKIYACREKNADDCYFAVYEQGGIRTMLIFSPSQRLVAEIEKMTPRRF